MKSPRSLHRRLIVAVALWSVGVLVGTVAIGVVVIHLLPRYALLVHNSMLIVSSVVLATAGVSVIRRSMSPFRMLREQLVAVREGRRARLEGDYPSEVEPLVADLNMLLEERERRVARAVARAGDLAHGLKTPLAILTQEIGHAERAGHDDLAASIRQQVERMRRQIDSHLAQARASASGPALAARTSVADAACGLARTMLRLHVDRALTITADVAPDLLVRVPVEDLEEMLGNLLDNACKWASSRVTVTAAPAGAHVVIDVDDDGPGLPASMREDVLQRGVRADTAIPGSGFGLAIVRDLADVYRGSITLDRSPHGGLRARLSLPAAS